MIPWLSDRAPRVHGKASRARAFALSAAPAWRFHSSTELRTPKALARSAVSFGLALV